MTVALGLVLGANLGSGFLALLATGGASPQVRRLPLGNLIFRAWARRSPSRCCRRRMAAAHARAVHEQVVWFHLASTCCWRCCSSASPAWWGASSNACCPSRAWAPTPTARATSTLGAGHASLAISCAAREALHQADVVETMMRGILPVIRHNDLELAEQLRQHGRHGRRAVYRRSSST